MLEVFFQYLSPSTLMPSMASKRERQKCHNNCRIDWTRRHGLDNGGSARTWTKNKRPWHTTNHWLWHIIVDVLHCISLLQPLQPLTLPLLLPPLLHLPTSIERHRFYGFTRIRLKRAKIPSDKTYEKKGSWKILETVGEEKMLKQKLKKWDISSWSTLGKAWEATTFLLVISSSFPFSHQSWSQNKFVSSMRGSGPAAGLLFSLACLILSF